MQFATVTILLTSMAATASAGLVPRKADRLVAGGAPALLTAKRATTCDTTPTATSGSASPIETVSANTAADCQTDCESNASCQSFSFGTNSDGTVTCLLYSVPAAQIPQTDGEMKAFDKSCSDVPDTEPTTTTGSSSETGTGSDSGSNGNTGSSGTGGNTGAGAGQTRRQAHGKGAAKTVFARDVCGSAPTGSGSGSTNDNGNVSPTQTLTNVNTAQDCLDKGKSTSGCQSVEFGKASSDAQQNVCLLFNVAVSELPAPAEGASLVAYDVGC